MRYAPLVPRARTRAHSPLVQRTRLPLRDDGSLRLAVVADTHSAPHPQTRENIEALRPDAILHAGDIGSLRFVDELAVVAPVFAVRGNIDVSLPGLPDVFVLDVGAPDRTLYRILMLHVGVYGPQLRSEVLRMARDENATAVVCGHSHIPFIGEHRGIFVFNPGSAGPRRFTLPIVFGVIDLTNNGLQSRHVECATGQTWLPPGGP